jgi:hypothetical protein
MSVLRQETSHLLLIHPNLGYGTVLTAAFAHQSCGVTDHHHHPHHHACSLEDCMRPDVESWEPYQLMVKKTRLTSISTIMNVLPLPCDLFLDRFCVSLSKQIQQRTTEVVCMAVWVPQLISNSIEEKVTS